VTVTVSLFIFETLDPDVDHANRETVALLAVAAGAGLIPAVHNLVLFSLTVH
jgi:hypothetical protein